MPRRTYHEKQVDDHPLCRWFAGCFRLASGTAKHPTLGDVPICKECRDWLGDDRRTLK